MAPNQSPYKTFGDDLIDLGPGAIQGDYVVAPNQFAQRLEEVQTLATGFVDRYPERSGDIQSDGLTDTPPARAPPASPMDDTAVNNPGITTPIRRANVDPYSDEWEVESASDIGPNDYEAGHVAAEPAIDDGVVKQEDDNEGLPVDVTNGMSALAIDDAANGIKGWSIWDNDQQRKRALKIHHNASGRATKVPSMFEYGIRYVRHCLPDIATSESEIGQTRHSRTLIIGNLPDKIELGAVLEHVYGQVVKAMIVHNPGGFGPKAACIYLKTAAQASDMYALIQTTGLYMADDMGTARRASAIVADTDSYPLSRELDRLITEGHTRVLNVKGLGGIEKLQAALQQCGLRKQIGSMVADIKELASDYYVVEFGSIQTASRVHRQLRDIATAEKGEVFFAKDPCTVDRPLMVAQSPYPSTVELNSRWGHLLTPPANGSPPPAARDSSPAHPSAPGAANTASAHARAEYLTQARRERCEAAMLSIARYKDVEAPTMFMENTADWTSDDIERTTGLNREGRWCLLERDPASGATQFRELEGDRQDGQPTLYPTQYREEWVREWLHYNLKSDISFVQETMDLYFKTNGLQNQRRLAELKFPIPPAPCP